MNKDLYILDCDPGIDDAMALLQLLTAKKSGQAELLCISIVKGNCSLENGVRNACRVLDTVQVDDVPVYKGASQPLVGYTGSLFAYHGQNGFNDVQFDSEPDQSRVKDDKSWIVMSDLTKKYPNKITLIATGPLTNIALAVHHDSDILSRVKDLFIMGGNTEAIGNESLAGEFNFYHDPEAASFVLKSVKCPTYIAAWELCFKYVQITRTWRKQNLEPLTTPAASLINKLEKVWFEGSWIWGEHWILCDQLAVTAALHRDSIKRSSKYYAQVETSGTLTRGMMVLDQRPMRDTTPNVTIIDEMDEKIIQNSLLNAFSL